jgi:hypothetical protein
VTVYLLEAYLPDSSAGDLAHVVERLSETARALTQAGLAVRYLRSTYVPEDATCFHYVEAPTVHAATSFAQRAGLSFDRILEARNAAVSSASSPEEER